jgi:hypothetical protein
MGIDKSFDEKIDVIDLIINVLKEHETKLDELVSRLESIPQRASVLEDSKLSESYVRSIPIENSRSMGPPVTAILDRWTDFRLKCQSARLVTFDTKDGTFKVSAIAGGILYVYSEEMPSMGITYKENGEGARVEGIDINKPGLMPTALREKLDCGLEFDREDITTQLDDGRSLHKIIYKIDSGIARSWITYQLGIEDSDVVQGMLKK